MAMKIAVMADMIALEREIATRLIRAGSFRQDAMLRPSNVLSECVRSTSIDEAETSPVRDYFASPGLRNANSSWP